MPLISAIGIESERKLKEIESEDDNKMSEMMTNVSTPSNEMLRMPCHLVESECYCVYVRLKVCVCVCVCLYECALEIDLNIY